MNRDFCDACNATVDMAHPNVDADTPEWIPFDPTRHNCAWCANCHQFLNQYFHGIGDGRCQIQTWGDRRAADGSAAVDKIAPVQ
jgi:hypothetical protein